MSSLATIFERKDVRALELSPRHLTIRPKYRGTTLIRKVCVVGPTHDPEIITILKEMGIQVVFSSEGAEYINEEDTAFLLADFESDVFQKLLRSSMQVCIIGAPYVRHHVKKKLTLTMPPQGRPRYSMQLEGVNLVISSRQTNRKRDWAFRAHSMGASVMKDVNNSTTHLMTERNYGKDCRISRSLGHKVINISWIDFLWDNHRDDINMDPNDTFLLNQHRLPCFLGISIFLVGFKAEDLVKIEHLTKEKVVYNIEEATHVLISRNSDEKKENKKAFHVNEEWFWESVDHDYARHEDPFAPGVKRAKTGGSPLRSSRSSLLSGSKSKTSLLSSSDGRKSIDNLMSVEAPQQEDKIRRVVKEMLDTEQRYIEALELLIEMKKGLHNSSDSWLSRHPNEGITVGDVNIMFGKIQPIVNVHKIIYQSLDHLCNNWTTNADVGKVWLTFKSELQQVYPPFINFYDAAKQKFEELERSNEKFLGYIRRCEANERWQRSRVIDNLVRPVQRLPSVMMLLNECLKQAEKMGVERDHLRDAVTCLNDILTTTNESRRKAEHYEKMIKFLTGIEKLPDEVKSMSRSLDGEITMRVIGGHYGWCHERKLMKIYLFNDIIVFCKIKPIDKGGTLGIVKRKIFRSNSRLDLSRDFSKDFESQRLKFVHLAQLHRFRDIHALGIDETGKATVFVFVIRNPEGDSELMMQVDPEACSVDDARIFIQKVQKNVSLIGGRPDVYREYDTESLIGYPRDTVIDTLTKQKLLSSSQISLMSCEASVTESTVSRRWTSRKDKGQSSSRQVSPSRTSVVMRSPWVGDGQNALRRLSLPESEHLLNLPAAVSACSPSNDSVHKGSYLKRALSNVSISLMRPFRSRASTADLKSEMTNHDSDLKNVEMRYSPSHLSRPDYRMSAHLPIQRDFKLDFPDSPGWNPENRRHSMHFESPMK